MDVYRDTVHYTTCCRLEEGDGSDEGERYEDPVNVLSLVDPHQHQRDRRRHRYYCSPYQHMNSEHGDVVFYLVVGTAGEHQGGSN